MDKQYFHDLGEYDEGMEVWGGENVELSIRVSVFVISQFTKKETTIYTIVVKVMDMRREFVYNTLLKSGSCISASTALWCYRWRRYYSEELGAGGRSVAG